MKTIPCYLKRNLLLIPATFISICSYSQTGTWSKVATNAPHNNEGVMLLLTDGTVICHNSSGGAYGTGWDKLTPSSSGSYASGTWTSIASMNHNRLFFPTQVLPNGQVFAAGGEYGTGATRGEYYDPVTNTWTNTGPVTGNMNIYDGNSEILSTGVVLVGVQNGTNPSFNDLFYTQSTNTWTTAPNAPLNHDEAQWLKLPDGSILFVGIATTQSCRYIPATNTWVPDANLPDSLYDKYGEEAGPAFMLPNGKAIFFGATGHNAIYTPSGTASPGTWATAAFFPKVNGVQVGQTDAPGAMMNNGNILLATSPIGTSPNNEFLNPVYFFEYNYTSNSFTRVTSKLPGLNADSLNGISCYQTTMLDLPDGTVLFAINQSSISTEYFIYTPGSAAIAAGKPVISQVIGGSCSPNYTLTGKNFNGISEGAAYGDDWQESTNYPLVRLSNGTNVYYCKTTNWNRVGAVQTDSLADTVQFTVPVSVPAGTYSLVVATNGFVSNPTIFTAGGSSPIITFSEANITCYGAANGSVNYTVSGGVSPFTYSWSNSATTSNISSLSPGLYTLKVTDHNGCTATQTESITQPALLRDSISSHTCSHSKNKVTIGVTGGTSPYTYSWSPGGATTASVSNLSAGTYTITVKDHNGCSNTIVQTFTCTGSHSQGSVAGVQNISDEEDNINLYPNPNTGQFTINGLEPGMKIEMYDYTGKRISTSFVNEKTMQFNMSEQAIGVYLVRILNSDGTLVSQKKVVKTK